MSDGILTLSNFFSWLTASTFNQKTTGEQRVPTAVGSFLVESKWNFKMDFKIGKLRKKHQNVYTPPASSPNGA